MAVGLHQSPTCPRPTLALIVVGGDGRALRGRQVSRRAGTCGAATEEEASEPLSTAGHKLLAEGKPHLAVADFARAHATDRNNREYLLSLGSAQLTDGQLSAAGDTLREVLDDDSNDGRANLLMARLMAADGRFKEADSYYHRAIYGKWTSDSPAAAAKARLELARMLASHGSSQELLSELLLLENEPALDLATQEANRCDVPANRIGTARCRRLSPPDPRRSR